MSSNAFGLDINIAKIDDDQMVAFGWASVVTDMEGNPLVDRQGDIIAIEELEGAVYEFVMSYAPTAGVNHEYPVGQLIESIVFTKEKLAALGLQDVKMALGWWVGFKIWDTRVWADIKSGKYKMFSIGGTGVRVEEEANS